MNMNSRFATFLALGASLTALVGTLVLLLIVTLQSPANASCDDSTKVVIPANAIVITKGSDYNVLKYKGQKFYGFGLGTVIYKNQEYNLTVGDVLGGEKVISITPNNLTVVKVKKGNNGIH